MSEGIPPLNRDNASPGKKKPFKRGLSSLPPTPKQPNRIIHPVKQLKNAAPR